MAERTEGEIVIEADASEVMEVIADFEAYPAWAEGVKATEVLARDDEGRGTEVAFEVSSMGLGAAYTLSYAYRPGHAGVSWTTKEAKSGVKDIEGEYALEDVDGDTKVTYRLQAEPAIPAPGLVKRQIEKRIVRTALEGLKRRVEEG